MYFELVNEMHNILKEKITFSKKAADVVLLLEWFKPVPYYPAQKVQILASACVYLHAGGTLYARERNPL